MIADLITENSVAVYFYVAVAFLAIGLAMIGGAFIAMLYGMSGI